MVQKEHPHILVTTHPFNNLHVETLEKYNFQVSINQIGRRLKKDDLLNISYNVDGIIAGTEPYDYDVLQKMKNLQLISRVGVGYDNIDLDICKKRNIKVLYTPESPKMAVADFVIGQLISLLRKSYLSNQNIRDGQWIRYMGDSIRELSVGIIGIGRIGKEVIKRLTPFNPKCIYACDLLPDYNFGKKFNLKWMKKNDLLRLSDIVSIHIPYNEYNHFFISYDELKILGNKKRNNKYLINTSRGKIVDEESLICSLENKIIDGAIIDVFENEPYEGKLIGFENVLLSAHIAASDSQSRFLMEKQATKNCIDFFTKKNIDEDFVVIKD